LIDAGHRAGRHGASALVSSPYATLDQVFLNRLKVVYMSLARSEKRRGVSKSRSVTGAGLSESSYLRVRVRDLGEFCGKYRVYRLMKQEGWRAQVGYRRKAGYYGKPAAVAENRLEQNFDVEAPQ
jgi:hypothetical protein